MTRPTAAQSKVAAITRARPVAVPAPPARSTPADIGQWAPAGSAAAMSDADWAQHLADTDAPPGPPPPRLTFQSVADLCAEVDAMGPPTWLFRGVWPADAYGVLAAEDKAGKTWAISDATVAVASGRPWLSSFPCDAPGSVLVFVGEGGKRNTVRRLRAVCEAHGERLEELPIVVVDRVPHLSSDAQLLEVERHLQQNPTQLVILDPLYLAARGASGSDLYAMGEALEGLQHVCQAAGAALLVVTHFRKQDGTARKSGAGRTAQRITGVGPSAWGRVLVTGVVESRYTEPETQRSRVVIGWQIVGGEVADRTFRTVREVWADDPEDLASPLHVTWAVVEDEPDSAADDEPDDLTPAARRVLAVLREHRDQALTVKGIGDRLAADGRALKARTIQDALNKLGPLVDSTTVDHRGTQEHRARTLGAAVEPEPAEDLWYPGEPR